DFDTGTTPFGVGVADFDGDGKADIAVVNNGSNSVGVFKNTSSRGTLSSSSLNPKIDFATGTTPVLIAIGDIDGDSKLDIAVPNYGSNTVSILLNTSTTGSISFAAKVDFPTGVNPWGIALG
ncbi:MAG: FG-GAP repeat domain-containing protein, partial [Flammeovirgaceae bacterium]